jgi:delta-aminolevulinic acid dehydratase/porphobilinogen synthase
MVSIDRPTDREPVDGVSPVRGRHAIRRMLERPALTPGDLCLPVLVTDSVDDLDGTPPTVSLKGLPRLVRQASDSGLRSIKLFAGGDVRDDRACEAASSSSVMVRAIAAAKDAASDVAVMTENCLCSYTADETVSAFGAGWGHYKLVDAAEAVSDAFAQLAANAKAAEVTINSHDVDRIRWALREFGREAASWMADCTAKGGGCADAVAVAAPDRLARCRLDT